MAVVDVLLDAFHIPAQRVAIDVEVHRDGRSHRIALQVGHFLHGDVDVGLLHVEVGLLDVHIELVAVGHIAIMQVVHLGVAHHRCIDVACSHGFHFCLGHQRVATCRNLSPVIDIALQADARSLQVLLVVVHFLRASEVEISHQGTHGTERRMVRILIDEVQRQHALKHTHLVDMTLQSVHDGILVLIGGTQCDVLVACDTAKTVGSKRLTKFLV